MITNLVVINPDHLLDDGKPNPSGLVYENAIVVHPDYRDKVYQALIDTFEEGCPPIVVSQNEWNQMLKFSKMIREAGSGAKSKFIGDEYSLWWSEILKRALEEADAYKRGSKESESTETPATDVPEVK